VPAVTTSPPAATTSSRSSRARAAALEAALAIQRGTRDHDWPQASLVRLRIGLHRGPSRADRDRVRGAVGPRRRAHLLRRARRPDRHVRRGSRRGRGLSAGGSRLDEPRRMAIPRTARAAGHLPSGRARPSYGLSPTPLCDRGQPADLIAARACHLADRTKNVDGEILRGQKTERPPRTIELLNALRQDLLELRPAAGRPADDELVFRSANGAAWREHGHRNWRPAHLPSACPKGAVLSTRPYDLRHSFASLASRSAGCPSSSSPSSSGRSPAMTLSTTRT